MRKKKIWAGFQRIIEKIVSNLSKIWVWDPGSVKKTIPDPGSGSQGQIGTGSRIWICNTEFNMAKPSGTFPLLPAKRYSEVPVVFYSEINSFNCEGLRGGGALLIFKFLVCR
jgi:hypothetical protein